MHVRTSVGSRAICAAHARAEPHKLKARKGQVFQAEIEQASEGARLGWAKKLGRSGEGVSKKGEGWGEKVSLAVNPKHFTELRSPTNREQ